MRRCWRSTSADAETRGTTCRNRLTHRKGEFMDRGELDAFLAEPRNAVLASVNAQHAPVQVPVFFDWHDGNAYVSVTNQRGFFPNFARNPKVALCIDDQGATDANGADPRRRGGD